MRRLNRGFTIVELLVVVFIIGLLAAIVIPAVQNSRESSRRSQCASKMRQLGIALQTYNDVYRTFPPGTSMGFSFLVRILPYTEHASVYSTVDMSKPAWAIANGPVRIDHIPLYRCPDDSLSYVVGSTNYAGNFGSGMQTYGYNGLFRPIAGDLDFGVVRTSDVTDGLSNTAAATELLIGNVADPASALRSVLPTPTGMTAPGQLELFAQVCASEAPSVAGNPLLRGTDWSHGDQLFTGYNHVLPPNHNSCKNGSSPQAGAYTAASLHRNGVNTVFADGHLSFISADIATPEWRAIGSRNGNEAVLY